VELFLTADNANMSLSEERAAEFTRVFSGEAVEALSFAFRSWRSSSQYFPAISQIGSLIEKWHREKREAAEAEKRRAEREAIEQARKDGKLIDFGDVMKQMNQIVQAAPEPDHMKRQREFNHRMQRAALAVGTLRLSEEEIRSRREKERAEIEHYREGFT
jgi:hypothetical protein